MGRTHLTSVAALVLIGACGTGMPPTSPGLNSGAPMVRDTCVDYGFRQPTPSAVVCPGAPGCLCTNGDTCCMDSVDSQKGVCEPVGRCRTLVLRCDGPEDCPDSSGNGDMSMPDGGAGARVCCLDEAVSMSGGGSSCRAAGLCRGKILCRTDDDCLAAVPSLPRCLPVDYGTPGVEDRGLDGLIGFCSR